MEMMRSGSLVDLIGNVNKSKRVPYTYRQARRLCLHCQFLKGKAFHKDYDSIGNIFTIIITPFAANERVEYINTCKKEKGILTLPANLGFYDVVAIAYMLPEKDIWVHMSITEYVRLNNVDLNPDYFLE